MGNEEASDIGEETVDDEDEQATEEEEEANETPAQGLPSGRTPRYSTLAGTTYN